MESELVRTELDGHVCIITLHRRDKRNAFDLQLTTALNEALDRFEDDPELWVAVLSGGPDMFSAGSDLKEGSGQTERGGEYGVIRRKRLKPLIAAAEGLALGGGMEILFCCDLIVASKDLRLGLPEVLLGILPGAGGTQRLPRLVGVEMALSMITSGKPISAKKALETGLVNKIGDEENISIAPVTEAINFAKSILKNNSHPKTREIQDKITDVDPSLFENTIKKITPKLRGREGPIRCIEAVRGSVELSFQDGLDNERRLFKICHDSEESEALIHSFFSERAANKIPGITKETPLRKIDNSVVIGCGTMGGGIAMSLANAGIPVSVIENDEEFLKKGMNIIRSNYSATVSKGRLSQEEMDTRMSLITPTTNWDCIKDTDLVIEAVFEEMPIKKEVFKKIDKLAKEGAILASNTSTLDID